MKYSVYGDSFAVISLAFFPSFFARFKFFSFSLCFSTMYSPSGYYFIFGVDLLEIVTSFMANGYGSHDKIGRVRWTVATNLTETKWWEWKNDGIFFLFEIALDSNQRKLHITVLGQWGLRSYNHLLFVCWIFSYNQFWKHKHRRCRSVCVSKIGFLLIPSPIPMKANTKQVTRDDICTRKWST